MNGLMMQQSLLVSSLLTHAERHHGDQEIVSRRVEGDVHRTTYRELASRSRRLANALAARGVQFGDRVATLAWNGYRHMELYYAVSGSGAVLHTLNPRLHPDQVVYIADHAEDQALFFDLTFLPLVEAIADRVKTIKTFVAMTDRAHMPAASKIRNLLCYEELAAANSDSFTWPSFDENQASSLCYTSGTTGNPKGVLYSHRSTLLHTFAIALPDALNCSAKDVILPVVPMFHVNAWGLPYAACMTGSKLVFPGPGLDGRSLYELFESERVTLSASNRSCRLLPSRNGPGNTSFAPTMQAAYGSPQALTWNIGTTGRMESRAEMHMTSGKAAANACSIVERWLYSAALGLPVVPLV